MKKLLTYLVILFAGLIGLMALFPEKTAELAVNAERSRSGLSHETVVIGDETWHYLEGGPEDGEVILLFHGFGGDKDNWTRFSNSLTGKYRVIAPDLPGFGESAQHPDWDYSLPPQRSRVNGFAQALGLDSEIGSIRPGKLADMVITAYNPLENFKVLYGTGHFRLDEDNQPARIGGVRYTIRDGIIYDAGELLSDVRVIVQKAREEKGQGPAPERLPYIPQ